MDIKKLVNSVLGSFLISSGIYLLTGLALPEPSGILFILSWICFGYWFYRQNSIKQIWHKSFIFLAIESFLMPIAGFIYSILFITNETKGTAEAIGGTIGGILVTGSLALLGFSLGLVFLLIGLFVFKIPKEVEVINKKPIKVKKVSK